MNIFSKMDNLVSLTENEKILVSYIKENPEAFVKMTSAEISEASFISNATIYRLCKKLDLAGLSELKILVSASVENYLKERKTLDFNYPIHPNETQYQITRTMQELYEQTVVSSLNNLDLEQLRQAASLMKRYHPSTCIPLPAICFSPRTSSFRCRKSTDSSMSLSKNIISV